jgi:hypothetical protein
MDWQNDRMHCAIRYEGKEFHFIEDRPIAFDCHSLSALTEWSQGHTYTLTMAAIVLSSVRSHI